MVLRREAETAIWLKWNERQFWKRKERDLVWVQTESRLFFGSVPNVIKKIMWFSLFAIHMLYFDHAYHEIP